MSRLRVTARDLVTRDKLDLPRLAQRLGVSRRSLDSVDWEVRYRPATLHAIEAAARSRFLTRPARELLGTAITLLRAWKALPCEGDVP